MSSLIDASETLGHETLNGEWDSGIIHFDATQRRKEKMRRKSQDSPTEQKPQPAANPGPTPALRAPAQPVPKPAPQVAATLDAYAPASSPAQAPALNELSGAKLEQFLIDFVVEQTGYPPEMVELDADLEADLGIDSIKKAQLFGELAERFQISVDVTDDNLSLDDFPTLAHVMRFLESESPATGAKTPAPEPEKTSAPSANGSTTEKAQVNPHANGNGTHSAPKPASEEPAALCPVLGGRDLEAFLVDFVVEQTGYPPEMVELDADLEADLGIDSIKKAQLFGELAEKFAISVDVTDENLSLDDFPTLRHVMEFLQSAGSKAPSAPQNGQAAVKPSAPAPANASPSAAPSANGARQPEPAAETSTSRISLGQEELEAFLVSFVVEQTGYPPEMVELDADLEADLGIDSIKKAQMMGELAERFQISVDVTDENLSLDDFPTLRHVCDFLAAPGKAAV